MPETRTNPPRPLAPAPRQPQLVKAARRQRLIYVLWAVALIGLGAILLAHNLGAWPANGAVAQIVPFWPVLLVAAGVIVFITGQAWLGFALPTFAIERGEYTSGHVRLAPGLSDLRVTAFAGASQLAVGQYPSFKGPQLHSEDGQARLVLDRRWAHPFLGGEWALALAKSLPWSFTILSQLGDLTLDLRGLNVSRLQLNSLLGHVRLTLPAAGQAEMRLRLGLGDLTVRIPEGTEVALKLRAGPLVNQRIDVPRLEPTGPGEWATPGAAAGAPHVTLVVRMGTGDLTVAGARD